MIELAVADWQAGRDHSEFASRGRRSREAKDWIMNPDRKASITFADACAVLNIEPSALRGKIQRKIEKAA